MEQTGIKKKKRKILVVEPSNADFSELSDILSDVYEIQHMCFGEELFLLVKQNVPDLILLDYEQDQQDWYQNIKRLKENKNSAQIPIIFVNRNAKETEILNNSIKKL